MAEKINVPTMVTIRKAAELTGLSYDYIRKLCINDKIVYVRAGNKYVVNLGKLIDFLNEGMKQQPAEGGVTWEKRSM